MISASFTPNKVNISASVINLYAFSYPDNAAKSVSLNTIGVTVTVGASFTPFTVTFTSTFTAGAFPSLTTTSNLTFEVSVLPNPSNPVLYMKKSPTFAAVPVRLKSIIFCAVNCTTPLCVFNIPVFVLVKSELSVTNEIVISSLISASFTPK